MNMKHLTSILFVFLFLLTMMTVHGQPKVKVGTNVGEKAPEIIEISVKQKLIKLSSL